MFLLRRSAWIAGLVMLVFWMAWPSIGAAESNGICYVDTACSAGNQQRARDSGSGLCVNIASCTAIWKCSAGPVTGNCGGGSQDCTFSPGCGEAVQDCFNGFCTSLSTCRDRIKYQGYSFNPTANQCSCSGNPPAAGPACSAASGICYVDTACSAGNQRRARDAGNGTCVDISTCTAIWKCSSGPTTGNCGGGFQDCAFSPGCGEAVQDCFNGFCTSLSTCQDRIKYQGYSFNPTANQCSCAGNPPPADPACSTPGRVLTVNRSGSGSGTVTSNPAGINCGTDCTESFASGTVVVLNAAPNAGSFFAGWFGDPDCADGIVTMDVDKTCVAVFNATGPTGCTNTVDNLCLSNNRFKIEATWRTSQGNQGTAKAVQLTTDTGYFWFFGSTNVEMVVKVLNACTLQPARFWVFAGGLTNVEVTMTVTDTSTGAVKRYTNPQGRAFQPILDTDAFATCP
jgi:hypothetical protein